MQVCGSVSLYVKIRHELSFGKAVFLVGGCQSLGNWKVLPSCRLDWTDDGCWRKRFLVPRNAKLQYKYVVGDFQDPKSQELDWETGSNRVIQSKLMDTNQAYLDQRWNTLRIKLQLLTDPNNEIDQMFVLGNCVDLGMKISKRSLLKNKFTSQSGDPRTLWTLIFTTDKQRKLIIYYYFAKTDYSIQRIREPGRYFSTNPDSPDNQFDRQSVQYWPGQIRITEFESFKGFRISKLTDHIFIGPYIKSRQDFVVLRQSGVKAVLNLQSQQDMNKYKIDWKSIKELAEEYGMKCCNFQIFDMNVSDFINKSSEALKLLHTMISLHGCVYIHCTAGIYRSPQLAILYLVRFQNYGLQQALQLIKNKRPYANPYLGCLRQALNEVCTSLGEVQSNIGNKSLLIDTI